MGILGPKKCRRFVGMKLYAGGCHLYFRQAVIRLIVVPR